MIRVVLFIAFVGLLALGVAWLADRPGEVSVTWLGYQIETSVAVAIAAMAALLAFAMLFWALIRTLWRSPKIVADATRRRRREKGLRAISHGLIAIGAGDARTAQRHRAEAERYASSEPLTLLLRAQTAQLSGDRASAEAAFRAMAERSDTKLLGLRGLYIEAQRHDDAKAARLFAEEAAKTAPTLSWAAKATLEYRCAAGDFDGALRVIEANLSNRLIDKKAYRRQRAVLLTAQALAAEEHDRETAKALVLEAVTLAPELVPAAVLASRFVSDAGETRRAARIIEKAWKAGPHPELADAYAYLRFGDSARDRLQRMQKLAALRPGHIEGQIALSRAAIDAGEFALARRTLETLLYAPKSFAAADGEGAAGSGPTQRVLMLMAELEEREHGDEGRAREWMTRALRAPRDPAWTADGYVSDRWMPASPVTGRLDAFEWKTPLAELTHSAPLGPEAGTPGIESKAAVNDSGPLAARGPEPASALVNLPSSEAAPSRPPSLKPVAEPVIPLVHAPDDPGPDDEVDFVFDPPPPHRAGWRRLRSVFR